MQWIKSMKGVKSSMVCKRIETQKEISKESAVLVSFRERFNDYFESYKNVAYESDVVVSSSQSSTVHDCTILLH